MLLNKLSTVMTQPYCADPFDLNRFVTAQNEVYSDVAEELRQGRKTSHWMWFVFPQIQGLGRSWMADKYAIGSRQEAGAYMAHPVLGSRLVECTVLVNDVDGRSIQQIFGSIDAMKFRSSMTLFCEIALEKKVFLEALNKYFAGQRDQLTLDQLAVLR